MKRIDIEVIKDIIHRLENQERNIDIAKACNVSLSTVEQINGCKSHTNLHSYKKNIRNENKPDGTYRINVLNEYYPEKDYYVLHIINTKGIEAFGKIDTEDYPRIKQYKWSLSVHGQEKRIVTNNSDMNRIGLHQIVLNNEDKDKVIDHINRDPLDNRKNNLRITSRSINSTNAKPRTENISGIRGVYYREARPGISKASWICEWSTEGKRHSKSFSIDKYGEEEAFRLAASYREEKLKEMKI